MAITIELLDEITDTVGFAKSRKSAEYSSALDRLESFDQSDVIAAAGWLLTGILRLSYVERPSDEALEALAESISEEFAPWVDLAPELILAGLLAAWGETTAAQFMSRSLFIMVLTLLLAKFVSQSSDQIVDHAKLSLVGI